MSLDLIQGYSSAEEEEEEEDELSSSSSLSDDRNGDESDGDVGDDAIARSRARARRGSLLSDPSKSSINSSLPSALDAFSEIAGPPEFLNNFVAAAEEPRGAPGVIDRRGRNKGRREKKKDLPAGVVVEAKAQLVGIQERVRSDVEGSAAPVEGKRVISASNPEPQDAAELLRMCLQCGIPKTYSHARGMVCPVCGDRPPADPTKGGAEKKNKGSTVKDKEKNKRMKGQSSHSTWKSETEMQLRQQFD